MSDGCRCDVGYVISNHNGHWRHKALQQTCKHVFRWHIKRKLQVFLTSKLQPWTMYYKIPDSQFSLVALRKDSKMITKPLKNKLFPVKHNKWLIGDQTMTMLRRLGNRRAGLWTESWSLMGYGVSRQRQDTRSVTRQESTRPDHFFSNNCSTDTRLASLVIDTRKYCNERIIYRYSPFNPSFVFNTYFEDNNDRRFILCLTFREMDAIT